MRVRQTGKEEVIVFQAFSFAEDNSKQANSERTRIKDEKEVEDTVSVVVVPSRTNEHE